MAVQDFFTTIGEHVQNAANVRTIFGEPISAQGKTIIPVANVAYGFGFGSGKQEHEEGGGGGAGVRIFPAGIFEVSAEGSRFISFTQKRKLALAAGIGFIFGVLMRRRSGRELVRSRG